jgi:mannose-6-phosphate isomerase-like protein (cupin superfamily)
MHALPTGIHKSQTLQYMRINKDVNSFHPNEVEISGLLIDQPREAGGTHAHMEAHLYVVQGSGYTTLGDDKVEWKAGTALQVPGPQTPHQHVNTSDEQAIMVRMAFGIRYFFEKIAKRDFPYLYLAPRQGLLPQDASTGAR